MIFRGLERTSIPRLTSPDFPPAAHSGAVLISCVFLPLSALPESLFVCLCHIPHFGEAQLFASKGDPYLHLYSHQKSPSHRAPSSIFQKESSDPQCFRRSPVLPCVLLCLSYPPENLTTEIFTPFLKITGKSSG
ncbi:hypothetical protein FQA47_021106 [Oryzias melastigma]|uniref:Uncharacterized protein n=1 Tax=Oryzias melastigma TaxID=30732 RepID=A0A834C2C0_ORYME|nr:hypothetical protein FQA47_021106 [Oryzias melastigma]